MFASFNAVGFFENLWGFIHIEGPMKESSFCPILVFQNGKTQILKLLGQVNSKTSFR